MMFKVFKFSKHGIYSRQFVGQGTTLRFLLRNSDMIIAPWFLDVSILNTYVCARAMSLIIPGAVTCLGIKVCPQLIALSHSHEQRHFQAAAARVNLGYMMICGAVALLTLSLGTQMAHYFGNENSIFNDILLWAVVGQSAPVLFGATKLLMHVKDRGVFHDLLLVFTTMLFLGIASLIIEQEASLIVQTWAVAQLTHAGLCALLLTQCGVWPGLTAIFHKEIRLF